MTTTRYDWIIIGSGFGGSVSALRLVQKGYRVLLIEKGRRFAKEDFPETNWDLRRWLWMPRVGLRGFFQMSFMEHVTILHGVGVGGGSLVYANTLPEPPDAFFESPTWAHLTDWKKELAPHYRMAKRMLGAARNPLETPADRALRKVAGDLGRASHFSMTDVGVFFGSPGETVADPYFDGEGPERVGCTFCGACMTGCRVGAKNTLDQNYLYLAEKAGLQILAEHEVRAIEPITSGGYRVRAEHSFQPLKRARRFEADRVVVAGGVMGSLPLLLEMKAHRRGLPKLSDRLGDGVRTNSEALIGVISPDQTQTLSTGVAITSILHTDDHSHIEPVRYGSGSGFFAALMLPHAPGQTARARFMQVLAAYFKNPKTWFKAYMSGDFARRTQILLYMRTLEGSLQMRLGRSVFTAFRKGLVTQLEAGMQPPEAFMPEATDLAERMARELGGVLGSLAPETVLGTPSTAHILGGAGMGADREEGVIDKDHEVFGYPGLYVIDGSSFTANPGVNPSLTITALAERAMTKIEGR